MITSLYSKLLVLILYMTSPLSQSLPYQDDRKLLLPHQFTNTLHIQDVSKHDLSEKEQSSFNKGGKDLYNKAKNNNIHNSEIELLNTLYSQEHKQLQDFNKHTASEGNPWERFKQLPETEGNTWDSDKQVQDFNKHPESEGNTWDSDKQVQDFNKHPKNEGNTWDSFKQLQDFTKHPASEGNPWEKFKKIHDFNKHPESEGNNWDSLKQLRDFNKHPARKSKAWEKFDTLSENSQIPHQLFNKQDRRLRTFSNQDNNSLSKIESNRLSEQNISSPNMPFIDVRVSDPHIWNAINELEQFSYMGSGTELPTGKVDTMETDVPGLPLNPDDFQRASAMVFDSIDTRITKDPIEYAGLYQGDINLAQMEEGLNFPIHDYISGKQTISRLQDNPFSTQPIKKQLRSVIPNLDRRWENGIVPYIISATFDENNRAVIAKAIEKFKKYTCIKFVPRTTEIHYIHILQGDGCSSSVGMIKKAQQLSLGPGCVYLGIVIHEFMHALGFWHEQSRSDRDTFIDIIWRNIQPGMEFNFEKYGGEMIENLAKYDTESVMHYGAYAFSKSKVKPTIVSKSGDPIGQRIGFSTTDIMKIRLLYKCKNDSGATTEKPVTTTRPNACQDYHNLCHGWSLMGECQNNSMWMQMFCPKSCNSCDMTCQDHAELCSYWAERKECGKNPSYMHIFCKKSCGLCDEDTASGTTTAPSTACKDDNANCMNWALIGQCPVNPNYMLRKCKKSCNAC